jgi:hypothetical protein
MTNVLATLCWGKWQWNSFYHPYEINKRCDAKSFSNETRKRSTEQAYSDHTGRRSIFFVDSDLSGCDEKVRSAHYIGCILWLLKEGG